MIQSSLPQDRAERLRERKRRWNHTPKGVECSRKRRAKAGKHPLLQRWYYVRRRALESVYRFTAGLALPKLRQSKFQSKKVVSKPHVPIATAGPNPILPRYVQFVTPTEARDLKRNAKIRRYLAKALEACIAQDVAAGILENVEWDRRIVLKLRSDADALEGKAARAITDGQRDRGIPKNAYVAMELEA